MEFLFPMQRLGLSMFLHPRPQLLVGFLCYSCSCQDSATCSRPSLFSPGTLGYDTFPLGLP